MRPGSHARSKSARGWVGSWGKCPKRGRITRVTADPHQPPAPQIRFCTSEDGVQIAWSMAGRGTPMLKAPNWLNHLELDATSPVWRSWMRRAMDSYMLVRYDGRGCGLSDRDVGAISSASLQLDLQAVVDAAGLDRFVLYGASQGAAVAVEYAARNPGRVSHLVLYGGYLRGARKRGNPRAAEEADAMLKLVELGWGRENSAFRQVFATQFIPDGTLEHLRAFDELQRRTVTAETAARLLSVLHDVDVTEHAARVQCPTLVLHSRGDARIPFEEGRKLAGAIPNAEFVPLDSQNHILLDHQSAWDRFFVEIESFLARHGVEAATASPALAELTPAESRVLDLLAAGLNNDRIAQKLEITPKTVRNHITHIFSKLGVDDRAAAIVLAREHGLGLRKP
jgi:pimeloyl-ACP methyl ester carboxylesterase/DNA-binding CsgD family transcriptional regulator